MNELSKIREIAISKMKDYRAELKARQTLKVLPEDGFWAWLVQEEYEYLSESWKKSLGYADNELKNHPETWMKLIDKEGLALALDNFDEHVKTKGEHPYYQVVNYTCKDGNINRYICKDEVTEWDNEGNPLVMIGTHEKID